LWETETLFETTDDSSLIRRITVGFIDFGTAALRPLGRKAIWRRLFRNFGLFYIVFLLWLHFIGYKSYHPVFHRVHETLKDSATSAIPLALLATVFIYLCTIAQR
jgi:hypothetical protein